MRQPYEDCPNFNTCNAPKCPLDPDINTRIKYADEDKCKAQKKTRIAVAKKHPNVLPYNGLTGQEYNGYKMANKLGSV